MPIFLRVAFSGDGGGDAWIALWGGLIGALIGAGVSGGISFFLQKREHDRADKVRKEERTAAQKSVANRLVVKLLAIASDFQRLDTHLNDQMAKVPVGADAWPIVLPLYVASSDIEYDAEETSLLLDLSLNEEFSLVASLPDLRNQAHEMMIQYSGKREQLWAMMPPEAFVRGGIEMPPQIALQSERLRTEMSDVLSYLTESVPQSSSESADALTTVHASLVAQALVTFKMEPRTSPHSQVDGSEAKI